jgi:hypothetical protein
MRIIIGVALALSLTLSVVPAIAGDTFHAFRTLSATEQTTLTPMHDDQLATVEGATPFSIPSIIVNVTVHPQINVCAVCEDVVQENLGAISQIVTVQ